MAIKVEDRVGQKFNRLTILGVLSKGYRDANGKWTHARLLVQCDCGTVKDVAAGCVTSGGTKSCGCLDTEATVRRNTTHGMSHLPEYKLWVDMRARCNNAGNKFFHRYGGRGITVCPSWLNDFAQFYSDMGPRPSPTHSIERKNNEGPYSPENCVWATPVEQANNKSSNRLITFQGRTQTLTQWCRERNMNLSTVTGRLDGRGWSIEKAFLTPAKPFVDRKDMRAAHDAKIAAKSAA